MYFDRTFVEPYFKLLFRLKGVTQNPKYHNGNDVYIHSLQVTKWALREANNNDLVFAALSHDFGKMIETKGHEDHSCEMIKDIASVKTIWLVKHHLRGRWYLTGEMRKLKKCKDLVNHPWWSELCQLIRWDTMGRKPNYLWEITIDDFIDRINKIAERQFKI